MQKLKMIFLHTGAAISFTFIALILVFVGYQSYLYYMNDMDPDYVLIDRCKDVGGQWNQDQNICIENQNENVISEP